MSIIPDTIRLSTNDYMIEPMANLGIKETTDNVTGEIKEGYLGTQTDGTIVYGDTAVIKSTLNQYGGKAKLINGGFLIIQFSASMVKSGGKHNHSPLNKTEFTEVCRDVEKMITGAGIQFNIAGCKLTRIDLTKNAIMREPFDKYVHILKSLAFKKQSINDEYNGSLYFGNKQHIIIVYDKGACCIKKGMQILPEYYDKNVMRLEYRLMNHQKIKSVTGMENIQDMIDRYEDLVEHYNKHLKSIFNYSEQPEYNSTKLSKRNKHREILLILETFKDSKSPAIECLKYLGYQAIIKKLGSIKEFEDLVVKNDFAKRTNGSTHRKKNLEMLQKIGSCNPESQAGLLNELIEKFIFET